VFLISLEKVSIIENTFDQFFINQIQEHPK